MCWQSDARSSNLHCPCRISLKWKLRTALACVAEMREVIEKHDEFLGERAIHGRSKIPFD